MRILIVTREHKDDLVYGLGRALTRISTGLKDRKHEVIYLSACDWSQKDHTRFNKFKTKVSRLTKWLGLSSELIYPLAERLVQSERALRILKQSDVTHIWFQDPWLAAAFLFLSPHHMKSSCRPRWGITEHGLGSFTHAVGFDGINFNHRTLSWMLRLENFVLKRAQWVWTPSKTALEALCSDLKVLSPPNHWGVLGYGAPEHRLPPRDTARDQLGWTKDTDYIITIGRISPVKRTNILIEACANAQKNLNRPLKLVILGKGDASTLITPDKTSGFAPLFAFSEDVSPYLAAADLYLSASKSESFGLANQESIGAGLPSILACGGATCEVAGQGAWIIDGSVESFTSAICTLLKDRNMLKFWSRQAIQQRQKWPTWDSVIDACERRLQVIS